MLQYIVWQHNMETSHRWGDVVQQQSAHWFAALLRWIAFLWSNWAWRNQNTLLQATIGSDRLGLSARPFRRECADNRRRHVVLVVCAFSHRRGVCVSWHHPRHLGGLVRIFSPAFSVRLFVRSIVHRLHTSRNQICGTREKQLDKSLWQKNESTPNEPETQSSTSCGVAPYSSNPLVLWRSKTGQWTEKIANVH